MTHEPTGTEEASPIVKLFAEGDGEVSSYRVALGDGKSVGRANFIDVNRAGRERIFFHTEVDQEYGGRGLAGLLLAESLADSIRGDIVVVPVCPLFARHLRDHGNEFIEAGGAFRAPTRADIDAVQRAVSHISSHDSADSR